MTASLAAASPASMPLWARASIWLGLAWSLFGLVQFVLSLMATPESLIAQGLTEAQAQVMTGYPVWMTLAFALGVGGGVLGCLLLLVRRRAAVPVLSLSLAGYLVLYAGDITEGVFAAMGAPQVIILTLVVVIAVALLWLGFWALRHRFLG